MITTLHTMHLAMAIERGVLCFIACAVLMILVLDAQLFASLAVSATRAGYWFMRAKFSEWKRAREPYNPRADVEWWRKGGLNPGDCTTCGTWCVVPLDATAQTCPKCIVADINAMRDRRAKPGATRALNPCRFNGADALVCEHAVLQDDSTVSFSMKRASPTLVIQTTLVAAYAANHPPFHIVTCSHVECTASHARAIELAANMHAQRLMQ